MQIYALKMVNFMRFSSSGNSIVFDITDEEKKKIKSNSVSMDDLYDLVRKDPISHIKAVKERGLANMLGICGVIGESYDSSNGAGKSTILEAICYALYDRVIRRVVNTDKIEKAGNSVITRINGKIPEKIKESYVELIFEEKGSVYILKRGRNITRSSSTPILEFVLVNSDKEDSQSGHRKADTNESISNVINIDFDVFCNSVMFGQADSGKFLNSTDKTRKEMLINLLHLEDVVTGCLENIRTKKNENSNILGGFRAQKELLLQSIQNKSESEFNNVIESKKQKIKEISDKVTANSNKIEELSKNDTLKQLEEIKNEGKKIKAELIAKKEQKNGQIKEWNVLLETNDKTINKANSTKTELERKCVDNERKIVQLQESIKSYNEEEVKNSFSKIEKAKLKKPEYVKLVEDTQAQKQEISNKSVLESSNMKKFQSEIDLLEKQIKNAGNKSEFVCDKCKSVVSKSHIESELAKNVKERDSAKLNLDAISIKQKENEDLLKDYNTKLNKINEWIMSESTVKLKVHDNDSAKTKLQEIIESVSGFKKEIKSKQEEIVELIKQKEQYSSKIKEINEKHDQEISRLKSELSGLSDKYKELESNAKTILNKIEEIKLSNIQFGREKDECTALIGSINKEIETLKNNAIKIKELEEKINATDILLNRLLALEKIYGLEGIQTRIVGKYLPLLNHFIKEFLDILSDGQINIKMIINESSKVDLTITGNTGNSFNMLSGGEKEICRMATSIGLAMLSFSRTTTKPSLICMDECFSPLDESHTDLVFRLLERLKDKFERILIISHDISVNERIKNKILVEKDIGNSAYSRIKTITTD